MNASVPVKTYAAELCGFMCLQSPAAYSVIGIVRTEVSLLGGPITILVRAFCDALVSRSRCSVSTILIALSLVETYSQRNAQSSPIRMPVHNASKMPKVGNEARLFLSGQNAHFLFSYLRIVDLHGRKDSLAL